VGSRFFAMSSFLDRLKKKDVVQTTSDDKKQDQIAAQNKPPAEAATPAEQLKVDIFQTPGAIIIYSQIAGSSIHDYSVTIEGDGDIVVIKGQRNRPNGDTFMDPQVPKAHEQQEHLLEECSWGKFYRQIILPAEVEASKTEAKMREGVLMLRLPLKEAHEKGVRIEVQQVQ
jgi:HSP20 family molecular chaperone IbpA